MTVKDDGHSIVAVIINFVNSALTGTFCLLGIACSIKALGITWFLFASVLNAFLSHFANECLWRAAERSQRLTTHILVKHHFGSSGALITKIFICVGQWTSVVNIMQICADFLPSLLHEYVGVSSSSFVCSRTFAVFIAALPISPWVTVKKISGLERLSMLCLGFTMWVIAVLLANAIQCIVIRKKSMYILMGDLSIDPLTCGSY